MKRFDCSGSSGWGFGLRGMATPLPGKKLPDVDERTSYDCTEQAPFEAPPIVRPDIPGAKEIGCKWPPRRTDIVLKIIAANDISETDAADASKGDGSTNAIACSRCQRNGFTEKGSFMSVRRRDDDAGV